MDDDDNDEEKKAGEDSPSPAFLPLDPSLSRSPVSASRILPQVDSGDANAGCAFSRVAGDHVCGDHGFVSHARAEKRAATFRSDLFFLIPLLDIFIARDATCTCL